MFKKPFKTSSHSFVSNKDKKIIKKALLKYMNKDSVEKFIKLCDPLASDKIAGTKITVYCNSLYPVLVDTTGSGDFFPSLYVVSAFPKIIKNMYVAQDVDYYLKNGANLMWPGVLDESELGEFKKDEIVCIRKKINNQPIAIGTVAISFEEYKKKGKEGIAAHVLHIVEDRLWEAGPQVFPEIIFDKNLSEPVEEIKKEEDAAKPLQLVQENHIDLDELNLQTTITDTPIALASQNLELKQNQENVVEKKEKKNHKKNSKNKKKIDEKKEESKLNEKNEENNQKVGEETKEANVSVELMDQFLIEACLNALAISVQDKDLPIEAGEFWSKHMLLCKKDDINLDIKNSSFKKLGKFLLHMMKDKDILTYQEAKKSLQPQIIKINRNNEILKSWKPSINHIAKKKIDDTETKSTKNESWISPIQIEEFCKPKPNIHCVFPASDHRDTNYTMVEAFKHFENYLRNQKLIDKGDVIINENLISMFGSSILSKIDEEEKSARRVISKSNMVDIFNKSLIQYHKISVNGKECTRQGNFSGINIKAEKRNNKNVNSIIGLELFGYDPEKLSSMFQLRFACSVSLHELPGKGNGYEMVVHGNFVDKIQGFLINECKINNRFIHIFDKLSKKKKQ